MLWSESRMYLFYDQLFYDRYEQWSDRLSLDYVVVLWIVFVWDGFIITSRYYWIAL